MKKLLILLVATALPPVSAVAQDAPRFTTERVTYRNPRDGMALTGTLFLPPGEGQFPGVALISIGDVEGLISRLTHLGYAVLLPERRGMTVTDRLLQATYQDLADDASAAVAYLAARSEVDSLAVGVVGQGDDSPSAALAADGEPRPAFIVLVSTTGLPGDESFQLEQRRLALERGFSPEAMDTLHRYVERLSEIIVTGTSPAARMARLFSLLEEPGQGLPWSAALPPNKEGRLRFLSSPVWHDRLAYRPDQVLGRIRPPVLVLMGQEDVFTPFQEHLPAIRKSLEAAPTPDVTLCLLPGRVHHTFSREAIEVLAEWLVGRVPPAQTQEVRSLSGGRAQEACLDEKAARGS